MRPHLPSADRAGSASTAPPRRRRRRDRRGRGLRGPLAPPQVPLSRSRAERFDELVEKAVARLEERWERELAGVEFAVAEVPPPPPTADPVAEEAVPLARAYPAVGATPPRIVVYRRPLEARAPDHRDLEDLVHDVVVEHVAELLGLSPETVDPGYDEGDEGEDEA